MKKLVVLLFAIGITTSVFAQDYAVNTAVTIKIDNGQITSGQDVDGTRSKNYSKTFPASRTDKVNLSNEFGTISIKTWDRREVKIDVNVIALSSNEAEAQRLVDDVVISASKNGDVIACKTNIGRGSRSGSKNRRRTVKVNYIVYMPSSNPLTVTQEFGTVNMSDFVGPLNAHVEYGDFNAGNLSGSNYISVAYGKANIGSVNRAVIKHQYGAGLTLGTAETLDLDAQYTGVRISGVKGDAIIKQQYGSGLTLGSVNNLDLDMQYSSANIGTVRGNATIGQQYNNLKIASVGKLNLRAEYAGVSIGTLRGDGAFTISYNNVRIDEIAAACKNLTVNSEYADLNLGFSSSYQGEFRVRKSYGSFKSGANVSGRISSSGDDETKVYTGKIGNGGNSSIRMNAEYGAVVFK